MVKLINFFPFNCTIIKIKSYYVHSKFTEYRESFPLKCDQRFLFKFNEFDKVPYYMYKSSYN